jgi:outer membrane protein assembly factor BamD (BamD/ComL family)
MIAGSAFDPDAALADYVAAVASGTRAPWADSAMFLAGNIEWNDKQNAEAAMMVWHRLLREYPKSPLADRCAFFIGLALFFSKQYPQAQKALEGYLQDYPDSEFTESAKEVLDKCNAIVDRPRTRASK